MPKDAGGAAGGKRQKGGEAKEWPRREKRDMPKEMPRKPAKRDEPKLFPSKRK